jgi:hypothetical protein
MTKRQAELLNEIKTWPPEERAEFADDVLRTLSAEYLDNIERLNIMEAERRLEAYVRGEMEALSGDEALDWLAKLGSKKQPS